MYVWYLSVYVIKLPDERERELDTAYEDCARDRLEPPHKLCRVFPFLFLFCPSFSAIACNAEYRAWGFERWRGSVLQPPMVTYGWCRDSSKGLTTVMMRIEVVVIATLTVKVWCWWWPGAVVGVCVMFSLAISFYFLFLFYP